MPTAMAREVLARAAVLAGRRLCTLSCSTPMREVSSPFGSCGGPSLCRASGNGGSISDRHAGAWLAARVGHFSSASAAQVGSDGHGKPPAPDGGEPLAKSAPSSSPGEDAAQAAPAAPAAAGGGGGGGGGGGAAMTGMSSFEKLSWMVCAGALAMIAVLKVYTGAWDIGLKKRKTEAQIEEERVLDQHRKESIRYMLAGGSFEKGDAFDGLSPEEIEKFADGAREEMGINGDEDPFEDMDPSEIDAYMQAFAAKEDEDENPS